MTRSVVNEVHITLVCEKECEYIFNFMHKIDFDIDIRNYPIDADSLFCADILIFQYSHQHQNRLTEISQVHHQHQYKPIIIISNQFDSKCMSWAITHKVNKIISFPEEISVLNNFIKENKNLNLPDPDTIDLLNIKINENYNYKTKKAILFIHNNFNSKIQISEVANICNMGISTFIRIFKKEQRITFCKYLQLLRFCTAKKLLRNTNRPISQIAFLCGFNDPAYFTRQFKFSENQTPKEYRELLK